MVTPKEIHDQKAERQTSNQLEISDPWNRFSCGFIVGCALHLLQLPMMAYANSFVSNSNPLDRRLRLLFLFGPSVTQIFYMAPALWYCHRKGRRLFAQGLIVNACIFFFLALLLGWAIAVIPWDE